MQNDLDLLRKNLNSKPYPKAACYRCPLLIHLVMYNTASKKKKKKKEKQHWEMEERRPNRITGRDC